jgi:hypothetical protein
MHYGRSRYVKVINEDGSSVTTKVVVKQLRHIPIMPRLKQLFVCEEMAQQMRWHKEGIRDSKDPDIMSHPVDAEAWHALDHFDPEFVMEHMSVSLGLSTDGFQTYNSDNNVYSCWPVFIMPYNLPPNKCLKEGFIFLTLVILGPKEPMKQMNIFLRLLMEELKELWQRVDVYDSHLKCEFNLWAAYLWSIHDYLTYGKFVGRCVHGRLNCPVCMDESDAFRLQHGRKVSFFDCQRRFLPLRHEFRGDKESFKKGRNIRKGPPKQKLEADIVKMLGELKKSQDGGFKGYGEKHNWTHKSCLWELPYVKILILPYNIDLMHQGRNVVESIINMYFDVTGFSKDNVNVRKDLANLCNRHLMEPKVNAKGNLKRTRTPYCLKPTETEVSRPLYV